MGKLQLLKSKDPKDKRKFVIVLKGRIVSRHRTLSNARKKFNKSLRIAKS